MAQPSCPCGAVRGTYSPGCEACRRRALKAEESRRRRARGREPGIRLPEGHLDALRRHMREVRDAEERYNDLRHGDEPLTHREIAALQGLGAALEISDLLETLMPQPISRLRNRLPG